MCDITSLDDHRPHCVIPTLDNNVHVVPISMLQDIVDGKLPVTDTEDGDLLIRSILSEWLEGLE